MATKPTNTETLDFIEVTGARSGYYLLGQAPLLFNAMSEKVKHELMFPKGRKSAAERAMTLKHNPLEEYRNSCYYARDPNSPTLLVHKSVAFKRATMGAAVDIPGARKAQMGRLMYVIGDEVPIYGVPELHMSVTRSADMNRTPDIRTRAILPTWCAYIEIEYVEPILKGAVISKLLAAAGMTQGIGDWRVEKGSGNYGRFAIVAEDHPQVRLLMDAGGREAQREALDHPIAYDSETEALLSWYDAEVNRRGFKEVA